MIWGKNIFLEGKNFIFETIGMPPSFQFTSDATEVCQTGTRGGMQIEVFICFVLQMPKTYGNITTINNYLLYTDKCVTK